MEDDFGSDAPLWHQHMDAFSRTDFTSRVSELIINRKDPRSIVVGIYGEWGVGKTTVLNYIDEALSNRGNIVTVWFNPWHFDDENYLIRSYFQTLAAALGRSLKNNKEMIGELLDKYATILLPLSFTFGGTINLAPGERLKDLGKGLSSVELDELKVRIEEILKNQNIRVVIFMDDIDRLSITEIHTVFKLVKLSANFDNTLYVLALDEKMVAKSIGRHYGGGTETDGKQFLEKIIQVPLYLPKLRSYDLRDYCFNSVDQAVQGAKITLSDDDVRVFVLYFTKGLEVRLKTPRMAKRYANALAFSLPLLKNEVNVVDLMLVEGLRIFFPEVYMLIRNHSRHFLGLDFIGFSESETTSKKIKDLIDEGQVYLLPEEKVAVNELLRYLFPRLEQVFDNTHHGPEWEDTWQRDKRICSQAYFDRYFAYAIPTGDISDVLIERFITYVETTTPKEICEYIRSIVDSKGVKALLSKLRANVGRIQPKGLTSLALALSQLGDLFSRQAPPIVGSSTFSEAGMLVATLIENIPDHKSRLDVAQRICAQGKPLGFPAECLRWLAIIEKKGNNQKLFTEDELNGLITKYAERIEIESERGVLYSDHAEDAAALLYYWAEGGKIEQIRAYIEKTLQDDPSNVNAFLKVFITKAWNMRSGLPVPGNLTSDSYKLIVRYADPDAVYAALYRLYGDRLPQQYGETNETHEDDEYTELSPEMRIAYQFARLHCKDKDSST